MYTNICVNVFLIANSYVLARPHNHDLDKEGNLGLSTRRGLGGQNAFHPGPYLHKGVGGPGHRRFPGTFGQASRASYLPNTENGPTKPKVVTIVRNSNRPRNNVKILLNRRSVQNFEQLMSDISEAFGPKFKNNKVKKLFTVRGKEVQGISDFFREDDVFIAVGNEKLSENDLFDIVEDTYADSPYAKTIHKELDRQRRKRQANNLKEIDPDKRDSGFGEGSDGSNRDPDGDYIIYHGRVENKGRKRNDFPKEYEMATHVDRERDKAATDERDRARKQQEKMMDAERRAHEEDKRKRGLVASKGEDPFKRLKEQKERDKEEARRRREEERKKQDEEEEREREKRREENKEKQKRDEERDRAVAAARERQAAAEKAEREKAERDRAEQERNDINKDKYKDDNGKNKEDKEPQKKTERKSKTKSKVIRKSKLERQVSGDGHVLSKYELGRTLGDGNFAVVKMAKLKNTNQEFAMKVIDKPKLKGKEHMVENEIEIMKDCHHPNIVKLYEEYETSDKIYLVMELVKVCQFPIS